MRCVIRRLSVTVAIAAWAAPLAAQPAAAPPIWFSQVRPSQELRIDFVSTGCFHRSHYALVYASTPEPRMTVTDLSDRVVTDPVTKANRIESGSVALGAATFTPGGVRRLDNLLRFYRTRREGQCTTVDRITFTLWENGQATLSESYEDSTCRPDLLDANPRDLRELKIAEPPVTSLGRIVWTVSEAHKRGRPLVAVPEIPSPDENEAAENVAMQRLLKKSRAMARSLDGSSAFLREWTIDDCLLGGVIPDLDALYITLSSRRSRLIDGAAWFNPTKGDRPLLNWNDLQAAITESERLVRPHKWLRDWKARGKGRSLILTVHGKRPCEKPEEVLPAWRHAGMKGMPFCAVDLSSEDSRYRGVVWFGKQDRRALITEASPLSPAPAAAPLERVEVRYHPSQPVPEYVVVQPNGAWTKNARSRRAPAAR